MQSSLHHRNILLFPDLIGSIGPLTKTRQSRLILIYLFLYALAAFFVLVFPNSLFSGFGHSLAFPGSGLFGGWGSESAPKSIDLSLFLLSIAALGAASFLWFATGNVVLPPLIWIVISIGSAFWQNEKSSPEFELWTTIVAFSSGPALIGLLYAYRFVTLRQGQAHRSAMNKRLSEAHTNVQVEITEQANELSFSDLQHMRLLLDRALQPVDEFEGFEWIDQFQTAAIRYQINFISYALSLTQANYMPAFTGYLFEAQKNLKAKQENHRIWKYWHLENLWGNLRKGADPIAHDNIMYSGFVGAQLAYARQSAPRNATSLDGLKCRSRDTEFAYSQDEMIKVLVSQYETADYGLLSCEPNWVYPLCNAITATAIRAHDTYHGTDYWGSISERFRRSLETEFITPKGQFVPFRSNYTGFAPPQVGGIVMQAFPCLFLNSLLPDIAQRQWSALQIDMKGKNWRKKLWPADVGNYGFSRASSYAATALSAREMGDNQTADLLLEYMDHDCPKILNNGISHNSNASLWANANAFIAKTGKKNALQRLVTSKREATSLYPFLANVDPAEVLIAKAKNIAGILSIVAYPTRCPGFKQMTIAGLIPHAKYKLTPGGHETFAALSDGTQVINFPLNGRTEIAINQVI